MSLCHVQQLNKTTLIAQASTKAAHSPCILSLFIELDVKVLQLALSYNGKRSAGKYLDLDCNLDHHQNSTVCC